MTRDEALRRAADARVGRIATIRPDGTPHVVPLVFALVSSSGSTTLYWAVDDKPKRTPGIARLRNLAAEPAAEIVVDAYDEDWSQLWWVRLRGTGRVVDDDRERRSALDALASKYVQYTRQRPGGPVVAVDVTDVASWRADEG